VVSNSSKHEFAACLCMSISMVRFVLGAFALGLVYVCKYKQDFAAFVYVLICMAK
jgi:hypothetical protein